MPFLIRPRKFGKSLFLSVLKKPILCFGLLIALNVCQSNVAPPEAVTPSFEILRIQGYLYVAPNR